jgi:energy-coupling factor transport system permease protein
MAMISHLEQIDPRVKFLCLGSFAVQILFFDAALSLAPVTVIVIAALLTIPLPVSLLMKRLRSVSVFIVFAIGMNMFTMNGKVLFTVFGMYATQEGLFQGMILSGRVVLLMLVATIFVGTTPLISIIDGIETTLRPVRQRLGGLIQVLVIALNFVPLLMQAARNIKNAQILNGAESDGNVVRQLRYAAQAVVPLFATGLRSSEHLALAMDSRCYDPRIARSLYRTLSLSMKDVVMLVLVSVQFFLAAASS